MKRILIVAQMREADRYTINDREVPSLTLMRRAGEALSREAEKIISQGEVLCVCGGGNNGGDGYVCAEILLESGREVTVVSVGESKSTDNAVCKQRFIDAGGRVQTDFPDRTYSLVVDCILGTGFYGEPKQEYAEAIARVNAYKRAGAKILSADIPSGLNGDNGKKSVCVEADVTLCIGEEKAGVYYGDGIDVAGEVRCADIGILLPEKNYAIRTEEEEVKKLLPKRKRNTHKGSYGRVAIIGGSAQYFGAGYLSAYGCLRAGAGYTYLYVPQSVLGYYVLKNPEMIVRALDGAGVRGMRKTLDEILQMQAVAYGMGMGVTKEVCEGAKYLLQEYTGKLLLDADALNALAKYEKGNLQPIFANKKCEVVLTPHVKEFSRLTGESVDEILEKGMLAPVEFAKRHEVTVLLKGAVTTITNGESIAVNAVGSAGQAKGGSGDALSGVIAGLMGQGLSAFDGAVAGAYLLGKSAKNLEKTISEYAMLATDVIDGLGAVFSELYVTE